MCLFSLSIRSNAVLYTHKKKHVGCCFDGIVFDCPNGFNCTIQMPLKNNRVFWVKWCNCIVSNDFSHACCIYCIVRPILFIFRIIDDISVVCYFATVIHTQFTDHQIDFIRRKVVVILYFNILCVYLRSISFKYLHLKYG